jgi:hypothetical protein
MNARFDPLWLAPIALFASATAPAEVYFDLGQVQAALFPNETLEPRSIALDAAQIDAIEKASGTRVPSPNLKVWRAPSGGWMFVDQVIGKHEFITYAVALEADGTVRQVEIMEYRESYGGEVRNGRWRKQFAGKKAGDALAIDDDIRNISGATLSCMHLTDGVRRLLATYATVLSDAA